MLCRFGCGYCTGRLLLWLYLQLFFSAVFSGCLGALPKLDCRGPSQCAVGVMLCDLFSIWPNAACLAGWLACTLSVPTVCGVMWLPLVWVLSSTKHLPRAGSWLARLADKKKSRYSFGLPLLDGTHPCPSRRHGRSFDPPACCSHCPSWSQRLEYLEPRILCGGALPSHNSFSLRVVTPLAWMFADTGLLLSFWKLPGLPPGMEAAPQWVLRSPFLQGSGGPLSAKLDLFESPASLLATAYGFHGGSVLFVALFAPCAAPGPLAALPCMFL